MVRAYITSAVAGAFLLGLATAALAVTGEFGNMCSMGLASGKEIQTDCSINSQILGQDLLLRQQGGNGGVHEEPNRKSYQGTGLLLVQASHVRSGCGDKQTCLGSRRAQRLVSKECGIRSLLVRGRRTFPSSPMIIPRPDG